MSKKVRCSICKKETEVDNCIIVAAEEGETTHVCLSCAVKINETVSLFIGDANSVPMAHDRPFVRGDRHNFIQDSLTPTKIKKSLDDYVIGQEYAKKVLAVAAYNHIKRVSLGDKDIQKSNVLLLGPTGSGKTLLAKHLARIMDVPVAIVPATSLTEAGYIGDDVESVLQKLILAAHGDVEKAEKGIVFIDEIDKLASNTSNGSGRSVGGKGVQQALLPILEGTIASVPSVTSNVGLGTPQKIDIDTTNILFICGGAFPEAEEIIRKRLNVKSPIGFSSSTPEEQIKLDEENILLKVTNEDLKEFGLIPEFLGRLPVVASLENLGVDDLKRIIIEPKDSIINQYRKLFSCDGVRLVFEDEALDCIALRAKEKGNGARSLRSILEDVLLELMFVIPDNKEVEEVRITHEYILGNGSPLIIFKNDLYMCHVKY